MYTKINFLSKIIPFFTLFDFTSTLLAFSHGAKEYGPLAAFFVERWGNAGLGIYAMLLLIVLFILYNRFLAKSFDRNLTPFQFLVLVSFYILLPSYWVGFIIAANFAFFLVPSSVLVIRQIAPLVVCGILSVYLMDYFPSIRNWFKR